VIMVGHESNEWTCWNAQATGATAGVAVVDLCDDDMETKTAEEVRHFFFRITSVSVSRVKVVRSLIIDTLRYWWRALLG
jgi:hypothetical protein